MQNAKKELRDVSEDNETQTLLSKLLNGEIKSLEPTFNPQTGYHYEAAEAIISDPVRISDVLNRLVEEKILERKLLDKIIYCPECGSSGISFRYCCPFCKSFNIKKSSLIEHVSCGYMDLEENFRKHGKLVCPKCHEQLQKLDVDYRKAGVWCACSECGKSFDIPVPEHYCPSCHATSNFEKAIIKDVYSYKLSEVAKSKMSSAGFMIEPLRDLLIKNGYRVESPSFLIGKSGAKHSFSLAAYSPRTNDVLVIDLAMSADGEVSEQPVIALFAKTFDVSTSKAFLVAVPKLAENARKMAELYSIRAIEVKSQTEAIEALKEALKK
jgi:hypothetical protein